MKKLRVEITNEAEADYRESVDFYAEDNRETARFFAREFRAVIDLLRERPLIGALYVDGTRKKLFPRFPYAVIYDVHPEQITVIAVAHHRRDPQYWVHRSRNRSR
ncbi:MAG TPA: type II toxin-antitoxin system RelE/ParE family toxin [Longimicrobium sp.]|nr:type II toxin-antitoxin system RelE/ParE family toxin [Longimicrobium sp.]